MAQPARHGDRAGKLYPPAIQSSASLHIGSDSNRRWMKVQWQISVISFYFFRDSLKSLREACRGELLFIAR